MKLAHSFDTDIIFNKHYKCSTDCIFSYASFYLMQNVTYETTNHFLLKQNNKKLW